MCSLVTIKHLKDVKSERQTEQFKALIQQYMQGLLRLKAHDAPVSENFTYYRLLLLSKVNL